MKYTVRKSFVQVVGTIWMPATTAAYEYPLRQYDIDNIKALGNGKLTRRAVQLWTDTNTGDFQSIKDFSASIEDGEKTRNFPWKHEESECTFNDCMYPSEDEYEDAAVAYEEQRIEEGQRRWAETGTSRK